MRFGHWLVLFVLCTVVAQAQQQDSLFIKHQFQVDSIRKEFYQKSESLKQAYAKKLAALSVSKDSLKQTAFENPTDSIKTKKLALLHALQNDIDSLKNQTKDKLNQLPLPADVSSQASAFSKELDSFKLPVSDLPMEAITDVQLPDLDFSKASIAIPNLDTTLPAMPTELKVGDQINNISNYTQGTEQLAGGLEQVEVLPETLENKALETSGLATVAEQVKDINLPNVQDPEKLKEEALKQAQEVAVDHFAGKEEVLAETMEKISKLKSKYSSLNSLSEIPKRRPNEMRGKPVIERLLPQVVFQVNNRNDDILVDWAHYVGWRFTGRLTAGGGWNQRMGYSTEHNYFHNQKRVYGPRVFGEYKWAKGFKPRIELEYMRTFIPPLGSGSKQDPPIQQWVPAVFVGLNKEYNFFGKVKGTSQIMLRVAGDKYKSPYNDIVNVRFGFEFPMKKKTKSPGINN